MIAYALTVFLSAFLLFQLQPMLGKYILPWFGGTPAVWTTCMLFFQSVLVAGYAYAHWSVRAAPYRQAIVHIVLLAGSLALLPIAPSDDWKPEGEEAPVGRILALLAASVGGPYLLLSSTGPMLQAWFARSRPGASPYRLFALSNVGSLLGLISYPFAVEPSLALRPQTTVWSIGYAAFVLCCAWCAMVMLRSPAVVADGLSDGSADDADAKAEPSPPGADRWLWLLLPACGSILVLAVTNHLCQDVAAVPFLWVLPLVLYLLSFILCFESPRWYHRGFWTMALIASAIPVGLLLREEAAADPRLQLVCGSAALLIGCMICHGELARLKPGARHLTGYFLTISVGGAAGGLFVGIAAPATFNGFWELPLGFAACVALYLWALFRDPASPLHRGRPDWAWMLIALLGVVSIVVIVELANIQMSRVVESSRNFYGVLYVNEFDRDDIDHTWRLVHGCILHGLQYRHPSRRSWPTTYYGPGSGAGLAILHHPRRAGGLRIGVIGLGVGTIAVHTRSGDTLRFYEINPDVIRLARDRFTFLSDSPAKVEVVLGDGRIRLERELASGPQGFDVLIVDAFSSDSIPLHLLTRECFDIYRRRLRPDGLLAVHITNRHLDLAPVVRGPADEAGLTVVRTYDPSHEQVNISGSDWMLVGDNPTFFANPRVTERMAAWTRHDRPPIVWTDDFSNLLRVLKSQ